VTNWSTIEVNVGIICASLPTARLMLVRLLPVLGGSRAPGGYYYDGKRNAVAGQPRSGTGSASDGGRPNDGTTERGGTIMYQKSFAVRYGEEQDEQSLVQMSDLERREGGTSSVRSEASFTT
jgi:hypothetical protein